MNPTKTNHRTLNIDALVKVSFEKIAPTWPLQNLIAINPLQGLETLSFEEALQQAEAYFEADDLPKKMSAVNIHTMKWLQVYCDQGQASITMPCKEEGLYVAWRKLAIYDEKLSQDAKERRTLLNTLPQTSEEAIDHYLQAFALQDEDQETFATLLITTLPGWASYIKYKNDYEGDTSLITDYFAIRLMLTFLVWPEAKTLIDWHKKKNKPIGPHFLNKLALRENRYRTDLLKKLAKEKIANTSNPKAQFIFCIDVRSEPFRRTLESLGDYETLGFAGFFGIPVAIKNKITDESYASCPVLLRPQHTIVESPSSYSWKSAAKAYHLKKILKKCYQALKYNFTSPFALVETLGGFYGLWMGIKTLMPNLAASIKTSMAYAMGEAETLHPCLHNIPLKEQYQYAETALKMMGLVEHFAPVVVLCGHGSETENNAYATALDCGACGGRHGGSNAKILASILNKDEVRLHLNQQGIALTQSTIFIAAEHNTTTDDVILYDADEIALEALIADLNKAQQINQASRLKTLGENPKTTKQSVSRAKDWAQVRPEWGLARNAAFIVGPRDLTKNMNLEGRCFLHSYDPNQDPEGLSLTTILTAPMVVAQWINMQYFFSTKNNIAYGGGSKITKNILGKFAIMQGNASDLMTGLPQQSLYTADNDPYHELQRLMVVVFAPKQKLNSIIEQQPVLQKLFGNGWVQLANIEPGKHQVSLLNRDLSWKNLA